MLTRRLWLVLNQWNHITIQLWRVHHLFCYNQCQCFKKSTKSQLLATLKRICLHSAIIFNVEKKKFFRPLLLGIWQHCLYDLLKEKNWLRPIRLASEQIGWTECGSLAIDGIAYFLNVGEQLTLMVAVQYSPALSYLIYYGSFLIIEIFKLWEINLSLLIFIGWVLLCKFWLESLNASLSHSCI